MGNGDTKSFIVQGGLYSNGHDKVFRSRHTYSSQKCHILEKLLHRSKGYIILLPSVLYDEEMG